MKLTLAAGALLLALSLPAFAQDKPVCDSYFDEVVASYDAKPDEARLAMIPAEDLPALVADIEARSGQRFEGVTRAFIVLLPLIKTVLVGLEIDGCLAPAINLTALLNSVDMSMFGPTRSPKAGVLA